MIAAFLTGISAAQNGPVTRICPNCRALLLTSTENCSFCHPAAETPAPRRSSRQIEFEDAGKNLWRKEVTRRLSDYRAKRGRPQREEEPDETRDQKRDEIRDDNRRLSQETRLATKPVTRTRTAIAHAPSTASAERLDICVQPELDFSSFHDDRVHPQTALVPVASLAQRRWAGMMDAGFVILTVAAFLTLFHSLGGDFIAGELDALVGASVIFLFYAVYFLIFTVLNGTTPGMQLCGLHTVRLDGTPPDTRQLIWRAFGYLLSGATLTFGYIWAIWDEDHFTWHDRISHTYVTSASPLG